MSNLTPKDIVPISQARIRLTELADEVSTTGHEKMFTKNGQSYVALIAAEQLAEYQRFKEAEQLNMLQALVEAAEDIQAGRTHSWEEFKPKLSKLRAKAKRIAGA